MLGGTTGGGGIKASSSLSVGVNDDHQLKKYANKNLFKNSADKDEEIRRHQPSSPAAARSFQVTQTSPSTFVAVARAVVVAVTVVVGGIRVGDGGGGGIAGGGGGGGG